MPKLTLQIITENIAYPAATEQETYEEIKQLLYSNATLTTPEGNSFVVRQVKWVEE